MIVVAEIASGGEIIPPSRNPNAHVKPGISELDTNAMTNDVMITIGNAKLVITRRHLQNSFHEICHAVASIVTLGWPFEIEIYWDGSGATRTTNIPTPSQLMGEHMGWSALTNAVRSCLFSRLYCRHKA